MGGGLRVRAGTEEEGTPAAGVWQGDAAWNGSCLSAAGRGHQAAQESSPAMPTIFLAERRLTEYESTVGRNVVVMLRRLAEPLAGLRVLHLSAGPFGSAVAEMLAGLVPLQRDLGIQADWHLLRGDAPRIWMALYEGLAGASVRWGTKERAAWHAY